MDSSNGNDGQLGEVMRRLTLEIRDGLKHGFFELSLVCETVKGRKRRLTINSGKKHQFTISEEEIDD